MNWKEFLKPNKKRIILALIILIIWFILGYAYTDTFNCIFLGFGPFNPLNSYCNDIAFVIGALSESVIYLIFTRELFYLLVVLVYFIASYFLAIILEFIYKKSKISKKFWALILIIIFVIYFLYLFYSKENVVKYSDMEVIKGTACREYLNQDSPCSDLDKIEFHWRSKLVKFRDFMADKTTFNCQDEDCIKNSCGCPGY